MSFDWNEYLSLAAQLTTRPQAKPNEEAKQRSAVSRAYYAAFNQARRYLKDKEHDPNIPQDGEAHEYVRLKFEEHDDERRIEVGKILGRLRGKRNRADYREVYARLDEDIPQVLKDAYKAIMILSEL